MPRVRVTLDEVLVREVEISQPRTTVGRRPYNDIVLDAMSVSGEHAVLELMGTTLLIEDLDSTNGTRVNGKRAKLAQLRHGDIVEIGGHRLQYLDEASSAARDAAAAQASRPIELNIPPTRPAPLGGMPPRTGACMRVLGGPRAGQDVPLVKIVTTFGKPGEGVIAIASRRQGYVLNPVEGQGALVNGAPVSEPVALADRDVIELSGVQMQFVLG